MKACKIFLAGALAITTSSADDTNPKTNPPIAYFFSYNQPGCLQKDQSDYITVVQTQDSHCYDFVPPPQSTVQSAFVDAIISGCVGEFSTASGPTSRFARSVLTILT